MTQPALVSVAMPFSVAVTMVMAMVMVMPVVMMPIAVIMVAGTPTNPVLIAGFVPMPLPTGMTAVDIDRRINMDHMDWLINPHGAVRDGRVERQRSGSFADKAPDARQPTVVH